MEHKATTLTATLALALLAMASPATATHDGDPDNCLTNDLTAGLGLGPVVSGYEMAGVITKGSGLSGVHLYTVFIPADTAFVVRTDVLPADNNVKFYVQDEPFAGVDNVPLALPGPTDPCASGEAWTEIADGDPISSSVGEWRIIGVVFTGEDVDDARAYALTLLLNAEQTCVATLGSDCPL